MKKMKKLPLYLIVVWLFSFTVSAQTSVQLVLGNPSDAVTDTNQPNNFLLVHTGFILSYNRARGAPNWVAWHVSESDIGNVDRTDAFAADTALPADWRIKPTDYSNSGFDRGHMCPSKDRSNTVANNKESFLMSNMQPQTPRLNRQTWKNLEDESRRIVGQGNELYVYAGCYGDGGKIKDKITIPTSCFKIIVVLRQGSRDLSRIGENTRIIAVDMPNNETLSTNWKNFATTIDEIEEKTGFDFLTTLSDEIETALESKKDTN